MAIRASRDAGGLVEDWIVHQVLEAQLRQPGISKGFVLDGYPRKEGQDAALVEMLAKLPSPAQLDHVVYLAIDRETALRRLKRRLICDRCDLPSTIDEALEGAPCIAECGGRMRKRLDDQDPSAVQRRLSMYESVTLPLTRAYSGQGILVTIDASQSIDSVLYELIGKLRLPASLLESP